MVGLQRRHMGVGQAENTSGIVREDGLHESRHGASGNGQSGNSSNLLRRGVTRSVFETRGKTTERNVLFR